MTNPRNPADGSKSQPQAPSQPPMAGMQETIPEHLALPYSTRHGDIVLREDRLLAFKNGLSGMKDCTVFGLSMLPLMPTSPVMLLHCINDPDITFLVADPVILGLQIEAKDRKAALEDTGFSEKDTQFLVILNRPFNPATGESEDFMTANLCGPILIETSTREGCQYIFANPAYSTQQKVG